MRERIECPVCGEGILRPIIYGLVGDGELRQKADRGEVVLGGCQVGQDSPDWECPGCGERFPESLGAGHESPRPTLSSADGVPLTRWTLNGLGLS